MSLKPILVVIMDGFGLSEEKEGNAVYFAKTPNLDKIFNTCPFSVLEASGLKVGLPKGQMGNSEVGHTNIGAGRVVFQDLTYIDKCILGGSFFENEKLLGVIKHVCENGASLHLMGLVSDGFVHSSINHLYALLRLAAKHKVKNTFIHVWTDGRDTAPDSAKKFIFELENFMKKLGVGEIKTVCGRFYSMDRDKRQERTDLAFAAMAKGKAEKEFENAGEYINLSYKAGVTDEFLVPAVKKGYQGIKENDAVVCFNFRADRARQISEKILGLKTVKYLGFTQYYQGVPCVFGAREVKNTLGEYLSACGLAQLRVAETEKYAHVTFFLNAGVEKPFEKEERILVKSPRVKTYDQAPKMSAEEVTLAVEKAVGSKKYDVIFVNYANPDMVGHTGNFEAAVEAVEKVDECVGRLSELVKKLGGVTVITADHGNAEKMRDSSGKIFTAHTCNLVPFAVEGYSCKLKKTGALCDIAPTILEILGLKKPAEMTGESLIL